MGLAAQLKKDYLKWYDQKLEFNELEKDIIRIDSPFKDKNSSSIILYVEFDPNTKKVVITDDGYTVVNLVMEGLKLTNSKSRFNLFLCKIHSYGVEFNTDTKEIFIETTIEKFSESKHKLLQCILFVNDMYLVSNKTVKEIFTEDVSRVFEENDLLYSKDISINGKSGMTHKFDFLIPGRNDDKFIKTISSPKKEVYSKAYVTDVNQSKLIKRDKKASYIFIFDNRNAELSPQVFSMLTESDILPIQFTDLEKNIHLLNVPS